jgi:hypothetical protein
MTKKNDKSNNGFAARASVDVKDFKALIIRVGYNFRAKGRTLADQINLTAFLFNGQFNPADNYCVNHFFSYLLASHESVLQDGYVKFNPVQCSITTEYLDSKIEEIFVVNDPRTLQFLINKIWFLLRKFDPQYSQTSMSKLGLDATRIENDLVVYCRPFLEVMGHKMTKNILVVLNGGFSFETKSDPYQNWIPNHIKFDQIELLYVDGLIDQSSYSSLLFLIEMVERCIDRYTAAEEIRNWQPSEVTMCECVAPLQNGDATRIISTVKLPVTNIDDLQDLHQFLILLTAHRDCDITTPLLADKLPQLTDSVTNIVLVPRQLDLAPHMAPSSAGTPLLHDYKAQNTKGMDRATTSSSGPQELAQESERTDCCEQTCNFIFRPFAG